MLSSLQILRGFAAWTVVLHHIVQSYFMGDAKDSIILTFALKHGSLGVDIFFVLSGAVMAMVANKYKQSGATFGINRFFRVVPVYWFYTLLLVISIWLLPNGIYLTWWEGDDLLKSLLFIPNINPNGYGYYPTLYVGWTLIYEMFFYLIFTAVLMLRLPRPAVSCAILLVIISLVFRESSFLGHSSLLLAEFSLGILIMEVMRLNIFKNSYLIQFVYILFFVLMCVLFRKQENYLLFNAVLSGLIVSLFMLSERLLSKENKILAFLRLIGDWSYSTYLSHVIIIGWVYYLFREHEIFISDTAAVISILILVMIISRLSFKLIETNSHITHLKQATIDLMNLNKKIR